MYLFVYTNSEYYFILTSKTVEVKIMKFYQWS